MKCFKLSPRLAVAALGLSLATSALAAPATPPASTQPAKPYPLKTCMVSGEDLGEMGEPIVLNYDGREIKFCCGGCVAKFKKDPAKYVKKLEEAEKQPTTKPS